MRRFDQFANFGFASTKNVIWKGAVLEGTNFKEAVLGNADFSGANIGGAHFEGAILDGANLCNTKRNPAPSKDGKTRQIGTQCPI